MVDEYTQKAVEKHKQQNEEDFRETFNADLQAADVLAEEQPIDRIYAWMRSDKLDGYRFALKRLPGCRSVQELAVLTQLLKRRHPAAGLNIYSEPNLAHTVAIADCISQLLRHLHTLHSTFSSETTKTICLMLNTILEQRVFTTELYKLLSSCEHAVDKILELNQTLPKAHRVDCSALTSRLMEVRRIEMRNWECMLVVKERKIERADLVELVHLCRTVYSQLSAEQAFALCEKYLREANLCTFLFRLEVLRRVQPTLDREVAVEIARVAGFYRSFLDEHAIMAGRVRTESKEQIKEYQKLAGWSSN